MKLPQRIMLVTILVAIFAFSVAVIVLAGPGGAQQIPENASADGERIDQNTILVDKELNDDGTATLTLYSETSQRIAVTDGGALFQGKTIDTASTVTRPQDYIELTVRVTPVDGKHAVALKTDDTHEGVVIDEDDTFLISGPWDATDAQITGLVGLVVALLVATALAYRKTNSNAQEPEKVA